jgi:hypothetical protein
MLLPLGGTVGSNPAGETKAENREFMRNGPIRLTEGRAVSCCLAAARD